MRLVFIVPPGYTCPMFGLSISEILVIAVVVLLVIGPEKLPEFMQVLGRTIWKIRHTSDELKESLKLPSMESIKRELLDDENER